MYTRISAVVCTHNRAAYLIGALQSLNRQTLDAALYEVIVVDNASTDNTREVFREFSGKENWRYIYEPVLGLSRARNTGWKNAKADYVFFMDDDAIAAPDTLEKYIIAFDACKVKVGCIAGSIELIWEAPRPSWFPNSFVRILSEYPYSDTAAVLDKCQGISACNLAVPKSVLQSVGGLREDLGRKGNTLLSSEEIDLKQKIDAAGFQSIYDPSARVKHRIMPNRLTKPWFRKHAFWIGRSNVILQRENGELPPLIDRILLSIKQIVWCIPRLALMLIALKPSDRFRRQYQLIQAFGQISGLWQREV